MIATFTQKTQQADLSAQIGKARILLEELGYAPLPVVQKQSAEKYPAKRGGKIIRDLEGKPKPLINGKSPSHLDKQGKPRLIKNWQSITEADPCWGDWAQYQAFGVANNHEDLLWIDIDRKRFSSDSKFDQIIDLIRKYAIISELSPNGWHGLIRMESRSQGGVNQINLAVAGIGHVGEVPGFIVCAPSRRADGSSYKLEFFNPDAPAVTSWDAIGLIPSAETAESTAVKPPQPAPAPAKSNLKLVTSPGAAAVDLEMLISKTCQEILKGDSDGDRSKALAKFARECYGWQNLANTENFQVSSADNLIAAAAAALEISDKCDRVLKGIDPAGCKPGLEFGQGRNKAIAKLKRLANLDPAEVEQFKENQKLRKLNKKELLGFLRENYNLQVDVWSQDILVNGEPLKGIDRFYVELTDKHDLDVSKAAAVDSAIYVAEENKRDEVLDYLEHCRYNVKPLPKERFDLIANFLFDIAEDFDNLALKKSLIASVARVYNPGCKVDECPVLQGAQGTGKSSFLRELAGSKYFNDNLDLSNGITKDDRAKLQGSWIHEIAELDKITSKREASELKAFITECVDNYRVPYERLPQKFARRCMLFATANPPQFLVDPTGNRRFPIIKIKKRIDLEKVRRYRDEIWAAAVQAYFDGESYHYDKEETGMINKRAEEFAFEDPWDSAVMDYLEGRDIATINGIMKHALEIETARQNTKETGRLAKILTRLGWSKGAKTRIDGKSVNPWYPPASPLQLELESCNNINYLTDIKRRHNQYELDKAFDRLSSEQKAKYQRLENELKAHIEAAAAEASQPAPTVEPHQPAAAGETEADQITEALPDHEIAEWSENLANAIDSCDADFYNVYRKLLQSDQDRIKFGMSLDYQAKLPQLKNAWKIKQNRALAGV